MILDLCSLGAFNQSFNFSTCDWPFIFSIFSWFSFGRLSVSKNLSIFSRLWVLLLLFVCFVCIQLLRVVPYDPLYFCSIPCNLTFSFQILLIWVLSSFFLMSLPKCLSILFVFSKIQILISLMFPIVFLISISFIPVLIFMTSCFLPILAFAC